MQVVIDISIEKGNGGDADNEMKSLSPLSTAFFIGNAKGDDVAVIVSATECDRYRSTTAMYESHAPDFFMSECRRVTHRLIFSCLIDTEYVQ